MAMKALVPVFPLAPEAARRSSLMARSKSIKNPRLSLPTMRFPIEMSRWRRPAFCRRDSCPWIQSARAPSSSPREAAS